MQLLAAWLVALVLTTFPAYASPASVEQQKMLAVIEKVNLGSNLGGIAFQAIQLTQTYRMMVHTMGEAKAQEAISKELVADMPKYQKEWDHNLAATYLEFFTPEQVGSIFTEKELSSYAQRYLADRESIGRSMQAKSKGLVEKLVTEVLTNSFHSIEPAKN